MPLNVIKKEIETEREVGYRYLQLLARAEALVSGAGREAIEPLLCDACAAVARVDVQTDRVVLDGTLNCQAVYRQGEENSLRALSARANISQAADVTGAQSGMLCRVQPEVENVEARYENGHMVFQVSLGVHLWVSKLEPVEIISDIEGAQDVQTRYRDLCVVKLAAEANETAVLTQQVEIPRALDARATLMDWGSVTVDSAEADLGGVRVKGRANIETLIASGVEGKPAVTVRYPIEFDKLLELPEWLSANACVYPSLRGVRSQLELGDGEQEGILQIQADVRFDIAANVQECVKALEDAYATAGRAISTQTQDIELVTGVACISQSETARGTVLLGEGNSVASVIAVRALPNVAEIHSENGRSRIQGLIDASVLYMPNGSDQPASARTTLPFEIDVAGELDHRSSVRICVTGAEANALMSDRLEMKIGLNLFCESRVNQRVQLARDVTEGEEISRRPGYIICWVGAQEDAWNLARRYGVTEQAVLDSADGELETGKALVLRV